MLLNYEIKMTKYSKGKVYEIRQNDVDDSSECYVGSTCRELNVRLINHRSCANKLINIEQNTDNNIGMRLYHLMNEHGHEQFYITSLEEYPCDNSDQLRAREEYWRKKLNAQWNMKRCFRSKEDRKEQKKETYYRHKEKINQRKRQNRLEETDEDKEQRKAERREYYENNKERIIELRKARRLEQHEAQKQKQRERYAKNKDKIAQDRKTKLHCVACDKWIGKNNMSDHKKSKTHIDNTTPEIEFISDAE